MAFIDQGIFVILQVIITIPQLLPIFINSSFFPNSWFWARDKGLLGNKVSMGIQKERSWGSYPSEIKKKYCENVFCPKAGPSLQAEKPRLQFCQRQIFNCKLRNQGCSFSRDLIGSVASRCFPHPTHSLASEQTLKDLKRSQRHQRGGEESGFG